MTDLLPITATLDATWEPPALICLHGAWFKPSAVEVVRPHRHTGQWNEPHGFVVALDMGGGSTVLLDGGPWSNDIEGLDVASVAAAICAALAPPLLADEEPEDTGDPGR